MINENKLEHLRYLHSIAERYKDSIFMRAYVLLTASGIEVAVLTGLVALLRDSKSQWKIELMSGIAVTLLIQFGAAASAINAIAPWKRGSVANLVRRRRKRHGGGILSVDEPRLSSFNRVREIERTQFLTLLADANETHLYNDLAVTYYNLCEAVSARYLALRRAFIYQQLSLFLFCIVSVLAAMYG